MRRCWSFEIVLRTIEDIDPVGDWWQGMLLNPPSAAEHLD